MKIVQVKCVGCGAGLRRMVGIPGQPYNWADHVRCDTCSSDDPRQAAADLLAGKAAARLQKRIVRFDAAAGYEHARLDDESVAGTLWARDARDAVDACAAGGPIRRGMFFVGPTGIGKTWAGFAIGNAAADRMGADGVRFATEESLLGRDVAPWELQARLERFTTGAHTLIVDDIGVATRRQDQIQGAWKELCGLIAAQPNPVLLIGTTNRQGWDGDAGLAAWMGAQAVSRIRQWSKDYTTGWEDKRTGQVHQRWRERLMGAAQRR